MPPSSGGLLQARGTEEAQRRAHPRMGWEGQGRTSGEAGLSQQQEDLVRPGRKTCPGELWACNRQGGFKRIVRELGGQSTRVCGTGREEETRAGKRLRGICVG